ncbi:MAG: imidazolonepropionase [Elusimicrobiales bacterium]
MALLITNISQLLTLKGRKGYRKGKELGEICVVEDACLYIEGETIRKFGKKNDVKNALKMRDVKEIDVGKRVVMPAFIDCHTHSVFAKPRLDDFQMRISGLSYSEIKKRGGGINLSAKHIKETSFNELVDKLIKFSNCFIECGTTTIEVKSGYGLDFENEIKILKVIKTALNKTDLEMIPTFLGAHSIPQGMSSDEYLELLKTRMIPYISEKKLAVFVDIFCEKGYFSPRQAKDYLNYAKKFGLIPKVHADQLSKSGGSLVAAQVCAATADHLDFADEHYIRRLADKKVAAVFLPASNYFLGVNRYPDALKFIENGCAVVLATDFNPGTSPCWNMQFVINLAVIKMRMSIEQAIVASTYNAACSLGLGERCGMIDEGMQADIIVIDASDYRELGYYFGANINWMTIKKGKVVYAKKGF